MREAEIEATQMVRERTVEIGGYLGGEGATVEMGGNSGGEGAVEMEVQRTRMRSVAGEPSLSVAWRTRAEEGATGATRPTGRRAAKRRPRDPKDPEARSSGSAAKTEVTARRISEGAAASPDERHRLWRRDVERERFLATTRSHTGGGAAHAPSRRTANAQDSRRDEWSASGGGMEKGVAKGGDRAGRRDETWLMVAAP